VNETIEKVDNTIEKTPRRLPRWAVAAAFIVLLAFLVLIAWGLRRSQRGPIVIGQQVPVFTLNTFDGQQINTADLKGKVIVLNFWASWCKPCEQEAADLQQAYEYYAPTGQVVFLGVDWVDTEPEAMGYLQKFGITYTNGPDLRTTISQIFRTTGVPETYFIDPAGKLAYVKKGPFLSLSEITAVIDPLIP
jgi:cytochrome c biogenesis protein CcmG, thiol:disulfide interchange protein DsbE